MKTYFIFSIFFVLTFCYTGCEFANAESEQVNISYNAETSSRFKAKKNAEKQAKKEAIIKYLKRINNAADINKIKILANEYTQFVENIIQEEFSFEKGIIEAVYIVEIDADRLKIEAEKLGIKSQGYLINFFVLEEPADRNAFDVIKAHLAKEDSDYKRPRFVFLNNYKLFQVKIRDKIIQKANEQGLIVTELDGDSQFEIYKERDPKLLGVYYDHKKREFVAYDDLLNILRKNFPSSIVFYYRIDNIFCDRGILTANISLSLKDLNTGEKKSAGSKRYSITLRGTNKEALLDGFGIVAENAVSILMNNIKVKIDTLISKSGNKPINVKIKMNSKRSLYRIKKEIIKLGYVKNSTLQNGVLSFQLSAGSDPDGFVFETLYNIFDDLQIIIAEKNISIKGKEIVINEYQ
ncbi:putative Flagellar assembly protein T N-terminal domain-containing protein [Candidatus Magnetomoraceae bacterium gMMP-1]